MITKYNIFLENVKQGKLYVEQGKIDNDTLDKIKEIDNSPNKKYVGWLCKQYINEPFDIASMKSYIEEYGVLVDRKLIDADINSFKSLDEFKSAVDNVNNTKSASRKELQTDYDVLVDDDRLLLIRPNTFEASRKLGLTVFKHRNNEKTGQQDSAWCTTYSNREHWDDYFYKNNVTFYYCKIKDKNLLNDIKQQYYKNELNVFAVAVMVNGELEIYDANDIEVSDTYDLVEYINILKYLAPHDINRQNKKKLDNLVIFQNETIDGNLTIDDNFLLDFDVSVKCKKINGNVLLVGKFTEIPKFFKNIIVNGDFICSNLKLKSLHGAPNIVMGSFVCKYSNIESLEGAPQVVGSWFDCSHNLLTTLEGCPTTVYGLDCSFNKLTTLKGCSQNIINLNCAVNNIKKIEYLPNKINDINLSNNMLTSLIGLPMKIDGTLDISKNDIKSLIGCPKYIGGSFVYNKSPFTKKEILKICNVNSSIYT